MKTTFWNKSVTYPTEVQPQTPAEQYPTHNWPSGGSWN